MTLSRSAQKAQPTGSRALYRLLPAGIRARLFLLIALVLIPLTMLLGWIYYQRFEVRHAQALQTELEVARGVAAAFASFVVGTQRQNHTVGQALLMSALEAQQATYFLANAAAQYVAIRNLNWINSNGVVVASSDPANVGRDLSLRPYVRKIIAGRPWVLDDLAPQGITSNRPTLTIATAVRDNDDYLRGMVVANIEPLGLEELILTQARPAGGAYAIFDSQGVLVFRIPEMLLTWEKRIAWRETDHLLQGVLTSGEAQTGVVGLPIPGGIWMSARVPVPEIGWVASAGRPREVALAPVRSQIRQDVLLAALIALAAFSLAWFVSRTIAGPLSALEADAHAMGDGRLVSRGDPAAPAEVRHLRATVEGMASGLIARAAELRRQEAESKRAAKALRQLKDELEARVQERTAELIAANQELEAFAYTVSHDLRAPLRHVGSFTELLEKDVGPALDERGKRYVRIIAEASRRMSSLIDDLLLFSRLGRATITKTAVDLSNLVEDVRRELAPEAAGRNIDWRIGALPQVMGDSILLRTVLVNLLDNALKYTRGRDPARIEVDCHKENDELVLFVRDNGAGFDMRYADKLFGVFQRLHPDSQFEGTGIGLASVRRIIERHGGRVWAQGGVNEGATFTFSLPVEQSN